MLIEICCDKFNQNGVMRDPIRFHPGLNVILGTSSGTNSIGKSTLLMIIDFVFGGRDYTSICTDVQKNVGVHVIKWKFQFDGEVYAFSRSTGNIFEVNICDDDYKIKAQISLDSYCDFLVDKYKLSDNNATLRELIGLFFRIYRRPTLDEKYPLTMAPRETLEKGISRLLKIYERYSEIAELSKLKEEADSKKNAFAAAQKYKYMRIPSSKDEVKDNEKRITELEEILRKLLSENEQGVLETEVLQDEEINRLKLQSKSIKRELVRLRAQLSSLRKDSDFNKKSFKNDYDDLREFFPDVREDRLQSIEDFHRQITKVLKREFTEATEKIQVSIDYANEEQREIDNQIRRVKEIPNVQLAAMQKYAAVQQELKVLKDANENFKQYGVLKDNAKDLKDRYNSAVVREIGGVQQEINDEMAKINSYIYDDTYYSPVLRIPDSSRYSFTTPNDGGTGTQYKGLIVFDLAALHLTRIPVIVHDSLLLKEIEIEAVERILKLYSETSKQVFIALDRQETFTSESQHILKENTVLSLSRGGNELFGRSWNKKDLKSGETENGD